MTNRSCGNIFDELDVSYTLVFNACKTSEGLIEFSSVSDRRCEDSILRYYKVFVILQYKKGSKIYEKNNKY